jgi:hypothetical protein
MSAFSRALRVFFVLVLYGAVAGLLIAPAQERQQMEQDTDPAAAPPEGPLLRTPEHDRYLRPRYPELARRHRIERLSDLRS